MLAVDLGVCGSWIHSPLNSDPADLCVKGTLEVI